MTDHHILFPKALWVYSDKAITLRSSFKIRLRESVHADLNYWVDQNIGYIPPIPPKELEQVYFKVSQHDGSLKSRLIYLIDSIRTIADQSPTSTVKISMALTWRNLELEGEYLGILPRQLL